MLARARGTAAVPGRLSQRSQPCARGLSLRTPPVGLRRWRLRTRRWAEQRKRRDEAVDRGRGAGLRAGWTQAMSRASTALKRVALSLTHIGSGLGLRHGPAGSSASGLPACGPHVGWGQGRVCLQADSVADSSHPSVVHMPRFMVTVSGGFRGQAGGRLQVVGVEAAQRGGGLACPVCAGPAVQPRGSCSSVSGSWAGRVPGVWAGDGMAGLPALVWMDWPGSWETLHLGRVTGRCFAAGTCPSRDRGLPACKEQTLVRVGAATEDAPSPPLPPHDREPALGVPGDSGRLPRPPDTLGVAQQEFRASPSRA